MECYGTDLLSHPCSLSNHQVWAVVMLYPHHKLAISQSALKGAIECSIVTIVSGQYFDGSNPRQQLQVLQVLQVLSIPGGLHLDGDWKAYSGTGHAVRSGAMT